MGTQYLYSQIRCSDTHFHEVMQMPLGTTSEATHALLCNKHIFLFPANIRSLHIPVQDYSTPLSK